MATARPERGPGTRAETYGAPRSWASQISASSAARSAQWAQTHHRLGNTWGFTLRRVMTRGMARRDRRYGVDAPEAFQRSPNTAEEEASSEGTAGEHAFGAAHPPVRAARFPHDRRAGDARPVVTLPRHGEHVRRARARSRVLVRTWMARTGLDRSARRRGPARDPRRHPRTRPRGGSARPGRVRRPRAERDRRAPRRARRRDRLLPRRAITPAHRGGRARSLPPARRRSASARTCSAPTAPSASRRHSKRASNPKMSGRACS